MARRSVYAVSFVFVAGLVIAAGVRASATPDVVVEKMSLPYRGLTIHGPTELNPQDLANLHATGGSPGERETMPAATCAAGDPACSTVDITSDGTGIETPPATTAWPADARLLSNRMDTGIAVGDSYVLVSSRDHVVVYDKAGHHLGPKYKQSVRGGAPAYIPFPNPFTVQSLFGFLTAEINAQINLPPGLPPGGNATLFGIDDYYDNRVLYDHYRKRFWIVAISQNSTLRRYVERVTFSVAKPKENWCTNPLDSSQPDQCGEWALTTYPALATARRGYTVAAVSKTEDPRDGFYLYWWDDDIKDGTCLPAGRQLAVCTDALAFGWQGGDYPTLGVDERYLLVANRVGYKDPSFLDGTTATALEWIRCGDANSCGSYPYEQMAVVPAGLLASGMQCQLPGCDGEPPARHFAVKFGKQTHIKDVRSLRPVVALTPTPNGAMFVNNYFDPDGTAWVVLWMLNGDDAAPFFNQERVGVRPWKRITWDLITNAMFRDGLVYTTWHEGQGKPVKQLIRTVRFDSLFPDNSNYLDATMGYHNAVDDPPGFGDVDYVWPAVAPTKSGALVTVYNRSSKDLAQEVRYSMLPAGGSMRPSRLLMPGEHDPNKSTVPNYQQPDTVGAAVDPYDQDSIWLAHIYADQESQLRIVVAKVLGSTHMDLEVGPMVAESADGNTATVTTVLINHGDGASDGGVLDVYLSSDSVLDRDDRAVGAVRFGAIEPGGEVPVRVTVRVDPATPVGTYYLLGRVTAGEEYSLRNNVTPATGQPVCVAADGQVSLVCRVGVTGGK